MPLPLFKGLGSIIPVKTLLIPASKIRSTQGGVLP